MVALLLVAAGTPPRNVAEPQWVDQVHPVLERPDSVVVKFAEGLVIRLHGRKWTDPRRGLLESAHQIIGAASVERFFTRSVIDLDAERERLLDSVPEGWPLPADLSNYYRVVTSGSQESVRIVNALNQLYEVELAYLEPSRQAVVPLGNDLAPTTPLHESGQAYLDVAPLGIGYWPVAHLVGARAPDLTIGQLEFAWFFGHEDACELILANVVGNRPANDPAFAPHGNAVAGILMANRNEYGVLGMANQAGMIIGGVFANSTPANNISITAAAAQAGDVFVASYAWVLGTGGQAPIDYFQADFDAIYAGTLSGITYCFGAGNAGQNLGNTALFGSRYRPGRPESGGIIVGGGRSTDLSPWPNSNHGTRVDCHAWAEDITTLNAGADLFDQSGNLQDYTATFGGTSGAGPIVAGVAAVISNVVREQNGEQLTPLQIQNLLRTIGTPQRPGVPIGPRPDLVQILGSLGLPDGLQIETTGFPGDPLRVEVSGDSNQPFLFMLSSTRGRYVTQLNRDLLIGMPVESVVVSQLDASGNATFDTQVPALSGSVSYLQVVDIRNNGELHLTNSVELAIR
jgi:hypothetical protein